MKRFTNSRKFLFGLSVSMVLAMTIGSFAFNETQTPANTRLETQSVAASNDGTSNFAVNGEGGTVSFVDPLLTIDGGSYTISMEEGVTSTSQRIELKGGATVTLDGVTVDDTTDGPALTISGSQDVTILLADGSKNVLTGKAGIRSDSNPGAPGIQKTDSASGWLIIGIPENSEGTGELEATGGYYAAGIGGGYDENVNNIMITGGIITANGGESAAGIGGGRASAAKVQNVNNITISGGTIIAEGGDDGDGIGAGENGNGTVNNITITGGKVTAKGGKLSGLVGSGIGGGTSGRVSNINISGGIIEAYGGNMGYGIGGSQASNNHIYGDDVVVIAEGARYALEGFDSIDKGLIFRKGYETSNQWQAKMYSNSVEVNGNVEFPARLTITTGKKLTVGSEANLTLASGAILTIDAGAELANDGTISAATEASIDNYGTITTRTHFYLADGTTPYGTDDYYQIYKTGGNVQKYKDLPNPDVTKLLKSSLNNTRFANWYYLNEEKKEVAIKDGDDGSDVLLNQHDFYENRVDLYAISTSEQGEGNITSDVAEAAKDDTVTFTVTPKEGYQLQENSLKVMAGTTAVAFTEDGGKYTFTMPDSEVKIIATFEGKSHEVTIDQPENGTVTIDPESPRTGDEVTVTLKPEEGYKPGGAPVVRDEDGNEIELTPTGNPGEYKFIMPNSDLTVDVNFVPDSTPTPPGPEPTPEPTPDPSVDPDGDGSGSGSSSKTSDPFMEGTAIALLGITATGAVILRKRK